MTFHDFFHDLIKLSKTLGLAKNTKPLLVLEQFLTGKGSTDTDAGVHQNPCRLRCLITSLYLTLSWLFHFR